jgi:integrase
MPRASETLKDLQVKNAVAVDKNLKLYDGKGLQILITKSGSKLWRFDYRFGGKRKTLALGSYPGVSLAKARRIANDYRNNVADGIDPGLEKKIAKTFLAGAGTFEAVAREWHERFSASWSPSHAKTTIARLQNDVFPFIGSERIKNLTPPELLIVLRRCEARGVLETAHRIKTICGQVFRYAVATGRAERDIAADLKDALPPYKKKHLAALTKPAQVGELLRAIDGYSGSFIVQSAMKLGALVFVRPGELRHAEWEEIDLDKAEWVIPDEKMKVKSQGDHLVPLSLQAVEILKAIQPLTCFSKYVFHCHRSTARPMSDNAINAAFRRMGFEKTEMTAHGFRAMARTILDEVLQVRVDLVEHQLAHAVRDANGRAYNRTSHLPERKEMMQLWADYLDGLRKGADVIPLRKQA